MVGELFPFAVSVTAEEESHYSFFRSWCNLTSAIEHSDILGQWAFPCSWPEVLCFCNANNHFMCVTTKKVLDDWQAQKVTQPMLVSSGVHNAKLKHNKQGTGNEPRVLYSLVQWNCFSTVIGCTWVTCFHWRQRSNFTAPGCKHMVGYEAPAKFYNQKRKNKEPEKGTTVYLGTWLGLELKAVQPLLGEFWAAVISAGFFQYQE